MTAVLAYLTEKTTTPGEWLRREPRATHPAILELVREATADAGLFYDDDVERYVNEKVGDLPPHERHGAGRDPIVAQLGHEVYIARGCLRDEAARAALAGFLADGFVPLADAELADGDRCVVRLGTQYSGQELPVYGEPRDVRVRAGAHGLVLLPKGARTHGWAAVEPALVKR